MKRIVVIPSIGLALLLIGAGPVLRGGVVRGAAGPIDSKADTCLYELHVPRDLDVPGTPAFDTTIVRTPGCVRHLLHFPAQGTSTSYRLQRDTVIREVGFHLHDESGSEWLDITDLPAGVYGVRLLACGNGGSFTLRIH